MNTTINNRIECNEPHANLDSYYGPYKTVKEALKALPEEETVNGVTYTKRHVGLTVGIGKESIVEYWFDGGTKDDNLKKKTTDGGLPGGVKIVMFDKNGGSGVQPSLLTDMDGYVVMPEPSVTRSEYNFTGWKLGDDIYQKGDLYEASDNAIFVAQWEKIKYTVSWNDTDTNAAITGSVKNNSQQPSGTLITLTAKPNTGYTFVQWTGLSGDLTSNPISFKLTADTIGISVETKQDETTYTVEFTYADGVESIKALCKAPDEEERNFDSGDNLPLNSIVTLIPIYIEGFSYLKWENVPEEGYEIDDNNGVLKINKLNEPIKVNLISQNIING